MDNTGRCSRQDRKLDKGWQQTEQPQTHEKGGGKEGKITLSLVVNIDFMRWEMESKTTGNIIAETVAVIPELRLADDILLGQTYYAFHNNKKMGGRIYAEHDYVNDDRSWLTGVDKQDEEAQDATLLIDDGAFKGAALALLQTYVDELVPMLDKTKTEGK